MRRYLLPENGQFYKANLHSHSTVSDGGLTPLELKERYKANGYSILAYTDHEILVDHSDMNDDDFLAITSVEYGLLELDDYFPSKTIELNMFAKDPHNVTQVCYDPKYVIHGEKWRAPIAKYTGDLFTREYTIECIQKIIDEANSNGFLVSLNHPQYSMETPEFFGKLNGLFAMEIYNHISSISGVYDYNSNMYDDMLRRGKKLFCIAADDCHLSHPDDHPDCDRYGGFVMIKAEKLEYKNVLEALENGDFYASQGPEIKELYIEDGIIHLKCSPAKHVTMTCAWRPFGGSRNAAKGEYLTEVTFPLPDRGQTYMRFDVVDEYGKRANTRAYFPEDYL